MNAAKATALEIFAKHPMLFRRAINTAFEIETVKLRPGGVPHDVRMVKYKLFIDSLQAAIDKGLFSFVQYNQGGNLSLKPSQATELSNKIPKSNIQDSVQLVTNSLHQLLQRYMQPIMTTVQMAVAEQFAQAAYRVDLTTLFNDPTKVAEQGKIQKLIEDIAERFSDGFQNLIDKLNLITTIALRKAKDLGIRSPEKIRELCQRNFQLIHEFSLMRFDLFNVVASLLLEANKEPSEKALNQYVGVKEIDKKLALVPTAQLLSETIDLYQALPAEVKTQGPAIGCPASSVTFSDDRTMMKVFFDWWMAVMDKFLFPHLDKVMVN